MYQSITACLLASVCALSAQSISLSGKVSGTGGAPISGAIVTLAGKNLKDTTGAAGTYAIAGGPSRVIPLPPFPRTEFPWSRARSASA